MDMSVRVSLCVHLCPYEAKHDLKLLTPSPQGPLSAPPVCLQTPSRADRLHHPPIHFLVHSQGTYGIVTLVPYGNYVCQLEQVLCAFPVPLVLDSPLIPKVA